ncbi:threonine ammonia-lyase [Heyndrickxia ginsengihumi]|uniref:threonine ammonia-lyase n=1 Tax=Heyndrickxia ginsengihumi TaxID=363870 RepID=UPI000A3F6633|nr:threonine ammonia-lyase [Heyndrickxia ginsengihumi]
MTERGDYLQTKDVISAFENLLPIIHRTPLNQSSTFNDMAGAQLYFKMENLQRTGSFKIRGALNKITNLSKYAKRNGVIAASAGNHAQGVAFSATKQGIKSKIYMPEKTPMAKVIATKAYGAEVVLTGESFQEAYEAALEDQKISGATFIHPYDDYEVMAGQGTIALEMIQQCSDLNTIVVPIGGGGLIAGVASLVKNFDPTIKVVGVQSTGAPATYNRFKGLGNHRLDNVTGIADGILVKESGRLTFPLINHYVDEIVTVSDEEIASAIILMLEREKMFVEGAGAAAFAAILSGKVNVAGKHVGVIVSGGNADIEKIPYFKRLAMSEKAKRKIVSL